MNGQWGPHEGILTPLWDEAIQWMAQNCPYGISVLTPTPEQDAWLLDYCKRWGAAVEEFRKKAEQEATWWYG